MLVCVTHGRLIWVSWFRSLEKVLGAYLADASDFLVILLWVWKIIPLFELMTVGKIIQLEDLKSQALGCFFLTRQGHEGGPVGYNGGIR